MSATTSTSSAFRRELRDEIVIEASAQAVWSVLTANDDYSWNPFMRRLEGTLALGESLSVEIHPPGGRPMKFKPTVQEVDEPRKLSWLGRFLIPGLLDGEHIFELEQLDGGRTRFVQTERFRGILVGVFSSTLDKTERGFVAMNAALKAKVEG